MPELLVKDLQASYGPARALTDIALSIGERETVGLLGRNGAGKTSLVRCLMNADGITSRGTITFGGAPLLGAPTYKIARAGLGWVPEDRRIFTSLTVAENLHLARGRGGDASEQLDRVVASMPLLQDLLPRQGFQLSGGEQQAVAIARALMSSPQLLLLDEPTEGLAPLVVAQLHEAIAELPAQYGLSILLAEQNYGFVSSLVDRVYVLDSGHVAWAGTQQELEGRPDVLDKHLSVGADHA